MRALRAFVPLLALVSSCASSPAISREELARKIAAGDTPFILDVRSTGEYEGGHVPGAYHIPFQSVGSRVGELDAVVADKSEPVVVYCAHGPRAAWAARALRKAGYTDVVYLEGHMTAWEEDGLPMEVPAPDRAATGD